MPFIPHTENDIRTMLEAIGARPDDPMVLVHAVVDLEVGFFRAHPHFGRLYLRTSSVLKGFSSTSGRSSPASCSTAERAPSMSPVTSTKPISERASSP